MVANHKLLSHTHVHILIRKFESENFLGDIEHNWVSLSLDQEVEWSIIDVVSDWSTEGLGGLTAEHNVKTCLLAWWNNLREWATLLQLWILVNQDPHIDVLSQVVGNDEALGGGRLNEDGFEVDLLWTSINLLELLSRKLDTTVANLSLSLWLSFPFSLDDSILVCISTKSCKVRLRWLISIYWLFNIKKINLCWDLELWLLHIWVHTKIWIFFNFF